MPPPTIVELEIGCKPMPGLDERAVGPQINIFILHAPPSSFYEHISTQRPLPSMLILMPLLMRMSVKASEVN